MAYGTRRFNAAFTRALQFPLPWSFQIINPVPRWKYYIFLWHSEKLKSLISKIGMYRCGSYLSRILVSPRQPSKETSWKLRLPPSIILMKKIMWESRFQHMRNLKNRKKIKGKEVSKRTVQIKCWSVLVSQKPLLMNRKWHVYTNNGWRKQNLEVARDCDIGGRERTVRNKKQAIRG